MTNIIFKIFSVLFATVKVLIVTGAISAVLLSTQERAFNAKKKGLVSLKSVNKELFKDYNEKLRRVSR